MKSALEKPINPRAELTSRKPGTGINNTGSKRSLPELPGISLAGLSDSELIRRTHRLDEIERDTVLSIIFHLLEIEKRGLYRERGCPSLFYFCIRSLGYSRSTAARRVRVVRCMRDYPEVRDMLSVGKINPCTVSMISGVLKPGNSKQLLSEVMGRSSRDVEAIVARYNPKLSVMDRVSTVYVRTELVLPESGDGAGGARGGESGVGIGPNVGTKEPRASVDNPAEDGGGGESVRVNHGGKRGNTCEDADISRRCDVLEKRLKIVFGVDPGFMNKVDQVKELLSARHPKGLDFETMFESLMDEYIERHSPEARMKRRKMRAAKAEKSQKTTNGPQAARGKDHGTVKERVDGPENSRFIPRSVRDEVFTRDIGQCTFVGLDGTRCESRWNLEIDHIVPYSRGGGNKAGNLRLLCPEHNRLEAERAYGKEFMQRYYRTE